MKLFSAATHSVSHRIMCIFLLYLIWFSHKSGSGTDCIICTLFNEITHFYQVPSVSDIRMPKIKNLLHLFLLKDIVTGSLAILADSYLIKCKAAANNLGFCKRWIWILWSLLMQKVSYFLLKILLHVPKDSPLNLVHYEFSTNKLCSFYWWF